MAKHAVGTVIDPSDNLKQMHAVWDDKGRKYQGKRKHGKYQGKRKHGCADDGSVPNCERGTVIIENGTVWKYFDHLSQWRVITFD